MVAYTAMLYILAFIGAFVICAFLIVLLFEPFEQIEEKKDVSGIILSLDELKEVRESYGYRLVKKPVKKPMKPCKCGCLKPKKIVTHDGFCYICPECHRRSNDGKTRYERRENWNKMM